MALLPQEWNLIGTPTTLTSPATPLSALTATPEAIFPLTQRHTFNIPLYKIIAMSIERSGPNNMHVTREVKACLAIHDW